MQDKNKTLEKQLCNFTIEYTSIRLKELVQKAKENEVDFNDNLLKDLTEITFSYNFFNEVEELELDFPLHNKVENLLNALKTIKESNNLTDKECYLGQIYNTYSNYCDKCNNVYDYLKRDELKKYLLTNILSFNDIDPSSIVNSKIESVIDLWISTLSDFSCKNENGVSSKFQEQLGKL